MLSCFRKEKRSPTLTLFSLTSVQYLWNFTMFKCSSWIKLSKTALTFSCGNEQTTSHFMSSLCPVLSHDMDMFISDGLLSVGPHSDQLECLVSVNIPICKCDQCPCQTIKSLDFTQTNNQSMFKDIYKHHKIPQ